MPEVPPPEELADGALPSRAELTVMPEKLREYYRSERPFEFRLIPPQETDGAAAAAGVQRVWMRTVDRLPDDDAMHRCLLAYASDFHLLRTATLPHVAAFLAGRRFMASIDHAMWFHWPVRVDEWFLYATDSPSASGARGFARGSIFSRDGRLLASTAQEGLMRAAG
jgi:acyl-CoA thioesterase-2